MTRANVRMHAAHVNMVQCAAEGGGAQVRFKGYRTQSVALHELVNQRLALAHSRC